MLHMNVLTPFDAATFQDQAADAAKLLRAMSNENMILCRLNGTECSVGELLTDFNLSQSALSQHLAILREKNLVTTRRVAQTIYYRIKDPAAAKVIETLADIFCPDDLK